MSVVSRMSVLELVEDFLVGGVVGCLELLCGKMI